MTTPTATTKLASMMRLHQQLLALSQAMGQEQVLGRMGGGMHFLSSNVEGLQAAVHRQADEIRQHYGVIIPVNLNENEAIRLLNREITISTLAAVQQAVTQDDHSVSTEPQTTAQTAAVSAIADAATPPVAAPEAANVVGEVTGSEHAIS